MQRSNLPTTTRNNACRTDMQCLIIEQDNWRQLLVLTIVNSWLQSCPRWHRFATSRDSWETTTLNFASTSNLNLAPFRGHEKKSCYKNAKGTLLSEHLPDPLLRQQMRPCWTCHKAAWQMALVLHRTPSDLLIKMLQKLQAWKSGI